MTSEYYKSLLYPFSVWKISHITKLIWVLRAKKEKGFNGTKVKILKGFNGTKIKILNVLSYKLNI